MENGAGDGTRTHNLRFTKPLLCQLSYAGKFLMLKFLIKKTGQKIIFTKRIKPLPARVFQFTLSTRLPTLLSQSTSQHQTTKAKTIEKTK
jgi:hypothetical protein